MNNIEDDNLVIIPCPSLSDYKEQPKDQSFCTAEPCPLCKNDMWLSEKKKLWLKMAKDLGKDIFLGCYGCLTKAIIIDEKLKKVIRKSKVFNI